MSKYKLIKKLPFENSPKVGYISEEKIGEEGAHYWNHNWFHPEDYPEFWEKVVEKNYKILNYISSTKKCIIDVNHEWLDHGNWNIHSIERLSDGEVFTVGGKVILPNKKIVNIKEITFSDDHIRLSYDSNKFITNDKLTGDWFNKIKKYKKPLFTTEDSVDIFDGDIYFWISSMAKTNICVNTANANSGTRKIPYFSTEEAAREYILVNRAKLSIKDILNTINLAEYEEIALKELVKSKL